MKSFRLPEFLLIAISLAGATPTYAQSPPLGILERGKIVYETHCAYCHGIDGTAETPVGRLFTPRPRNFADPVEMARLTVDRIYRDTKEGRPGTAMPAWGQVLTETQIGDVIDYIRSLASPRAPTMSAAQISLEVGRRIYRKECEACHGSDGAGNPDVIQVFRSRPRNFADPIEMSRVDDGRMYSALKLGRAGTIMGGWGELLSPAEIIDVMRYVRTLARPLPAAMTAAKLDVAVGEKIYQQHCISCHGEKGDGQTPLGQSLIPRPLDLSRPQEEVRTSDAEMTRVIARGNPGTAMAPWRGILNSEDIRRVIAYIRQTFRPSPRQP